MLIQVETRGNITSVPIDNGYLKISQLFFVDNSLLFCKDNSIEWCNLISLLKLYEQASGQILNKDKTFIFFSQNTPHDVRQMIIQIAGIQVTESLEKYLGLLP